MTWVRFGIQQTKTLPGTRRMVEVDGMATCGHPFRGPRGLFHFHDSFRESIDLHRMYRSS